jgi:hypothetical protein
MQALFQSAPHIYKKTEGSGYGRLKNMRIRIPNTGLQEQKTEVNLSSGSGQFGFMTFSKPGSYSVFMLYLMQDRNHLFNLYKLLD